MITDSLIQFVHNNVQFWPSRDDLENAFKEYEVRKEFIAPESDFWMMNKLRNSLDTFTILRRPSKHEIKQAVLTIQRFKSTSPI